MSRAPHVVVLQGSRASVVPGSPGSPGSAGSPDSPDDRFGAFFHQVASMAGDIDTLDHLDAQVLAPCDTLLISAPPSDIDPGTIREVARFLERGGSVLWVNDEPGTVGKGVLAAPWSNGLTLRRREIDGTSLRRRQSYGAGLWLRPLLPMPIWCDEVCTLEIPASRIDEVEGFRAWPPDKPPTLPWHGITRGRAGEFAIVCVPIGAGQLIYVGRSALLSPRTSLPTAPSATTDRRSGLPSSLPTGLPPGIAPGPAPGPGPWPRGTLTFLTWLTSRWLRAIPRDVDRRMKHAQRHRLLHGYPMEPLMHREPDPALRKLLWEQSLERPGRKTIVGVLPHPFCNPKVKGCGFCTFPHEEYKKPLVSEVVESVRLEIGLGRMFHREKTVVDAVYLGGGTANLTPLDDLKKLCETLAVSFDLKGAEVTLEGVPLYFVARSPGPLDVLQESLPESQIRISMGVQTFDPAWLQRMGRQAFGDHQTFATVVREARARKMGISLDLLHNLPGQSFEAMQSDLDRAIDLGTDQICLYHLVLEEDMSSAWAQDRSLLSKRPDNETGCQSWILLRERLLAAGFVQTTLTNFERAERLEAGLGFRYETMGFCPERVDVLGFGPGAGSVMGAPRGMMWKTMNASTADAYVARSQGSTWMDRYFALGPQDVQILWITRKIAMCGLDRQAFRSLFHREILDVFGAEFEACRARDLCTITPARIDLTPRGMFFADTVAGIVAYRQIEERKLTSWIRDQRPTRTEAPVYSLDDGLDQSIRSRMAYDPNEARHHGMG